MSAAGQAIATSICDICKVFEIRVHGQKVRWRKHIYAKVIGAVDMKGSLMTISFKYTVATHPFQHHVGHSSHYPEGIDSLKGSGIILFTIVPLTTHEMKSPDTAVFNPLAS